jgi:transposase-like protein
MAKERIERIINGKSAHVYSVEWIKEIVQEISEQKLTVHEAMEKYGIRRKVTIQSWFERYGDPQRVKMRKRLPLDQKRQIVYEIDSGQMTVLDAMRKHDLSRTCIEAWIKLYSPEINGSNKPLKMEKQDKEVSVPEKKVVDEMKLKIAALETMIDVAEKEFGIDIRKKSGTKQ